MAYFSNIKSLNELLYKPVGWGEWFYEPQHATTKLLRCAIAYHQPTIKVFITRDLGRPFSLAS